MQESTSPESSCGLSAVLSYVPEPLVWVVPIGSAICMRDEYIHVLAYCEYPPRGKVVKYVIADGEERYVVSIRPRAGDPRTHLFSLSASAFYLAPSQIITDRSRSSAWNVSRGEHVWVRLPRVRWGSGEFSENVTIRAVVVRDAGLGTYCVRPIGDVLGLSKLPMVVPTAIVERTAGHVAIREWRLRGAEDDHVHTSVVSNS